MLQARNRIDLYFCNIMFSFMKCAITLLVNNLLITAIVIAKKTYIGKDYMLF